MNRRDFIRTVSGGLLAATLPGAASALSPQPLSPALYRALQNGDRVSMLLCWSEWSLTCGFQRDQIAALLAERPDYADRIDFVHVDYDTYGKSRLLQGLKLERRSTLIALRGKRELDRVVAETRPERIRALLDTALDASAA